MHQNKCKQVAASTPEMRIGGSQGKASKPFGFGPFWPHSRSFGGFRPQKGHRDTAEESRGTPRTQPRQITGFNFLACLNSAHGCLLRRKNTTCPKASC